MESCSGILILKICLCLCSQFNSTYIDKSTAHANFSYFSINTSLYPWMFDDFKQSPSNFPDMEIIFLLLHEPATCLLQKYILDAD